MLHDAVNMQENNYSKISAGSKLMSNSEELKKQMTDINIYPVTVRLSY